MADIQWTTRAEQDAGEIAAYIALDSAAAAQDWLVELITAVESLRDFPQLGRVVPEFGIDSIRELLHGRYRIVYELGADRVTVLTVFDGSRLLRL